MDGNVGFGRANNAGVAAVQAPVTVLLNPDTELPDASLVALAGRLRTTRVATLDHRHFRTVTLADGRPFTVLPADAP
jgi:hypothetical protein